MEYLPIPEPGAGQILVRTRWLAFDPAQRGYLNDIPSYVAPLAIGEVMRASGVGEVVASQNPAFAVGSSVAAHVGWQEYALVDPSDPEAAVVAVPEGLADQRAMLHTLGTTGLTAYIGMAEFGAPRPGDTVLVTSAAGATGSVAGQIARRLGASRVIGTAGSPEKRAWTIEHAGFDECLDHYDSGVFRAIRRAAPGGIDVVFDNVGGALLDATLGNLAIGARVVLCGAISTGYTPTRPEVGLRNYQFLTGQRARMEGFIVLDHADRYPAIRTTLAQWLAEGALQSQYDVTVGLEHAPATLERLFAGANVGKQLLQVRPDTN